MKRILLILLMINAGNNWAQTSCSVDFSVSNPPSPCTGVSLTLSVNGASGLVFSVAWVFEDGSSATGKTVTHTFTSVPSQGSVYATATITVLEASSQYPKNYTCTRELYSTNPCIKIDIPEEPPVAPGNPFLKGEEGNWRVKRVWVLQSERKQTRLGTADNLNLRLDGTYRNFYAFWNPNTTSGGYWIKQNDDKWTFKTQINHYNPFGSYELENVDPLSRHSAVVYGFNHTLPVAIAANARYREIAFDSFEDYDFGKCANNHFSFQFVNGIENKINASNSHSGRRSIRLSPGETVIMQKQFVKCPEEEKPVVIK